MHIPRVQYVANCHRLVQYICGVAHVIMSRYKASYESYDSVCVCVCVCVCVRVCMCVGSHVVGHEQFGKFDSCRGPHPLVAVNLSRKEHLGALAVLVSERVVICDDSDILSARLIPCTARSIPTAVHETGFDRNESIVRKERKGEKKSCAAERSDKQCDRRRSGRR